ncbi:hypothetical protein THAOC_18929 [Thalassiosira oceanica]|uniref:Uncharacterized protein n=1 Tax=Thalassiosira oceanica TaxID=159749 RepID=K0SQU4_THAOC|nr:hypothetical protein THAOC_18929 [Thalassiosira oceanica]|eukprot:EJK60677.1 hypothetical protein THAOC_18929 [Thalassiosira oceanica]
MRCPTSPPPCRGGSTALVKVQRGPGPVEPAWGKAGLDCLVSTPLRLAECMERGMRADGCRFLVLDEADRLLDVSDGGATGGGGRWGRQRRRWEAVGHVAVPDVPPADRRGPVLAPADGHPRAVLGDARAVCPSPLRVHPTGSPGRRHGGAVRGGLGRLGGQRAHQAGAQVRRTGGGEAPRDTPAGHGWHRPARPHLASSRARRGRRRCLAS